MDYKRCGVCWTNGSQGLKDGAYRDSQDGMEEQIPSSTNFNEIIFNY